MLLLEADSAEDLTLRAYEGYLDRFYSATRVASCHPFKVPAGGAGSPAGMRDGRFKPRHRRFGQCAGVLPFGGQALQQDQAVGVDVRRPDRPAR